jgi:hypothetical protein
MNRRTPKSAKLELRAGGSLGDLQTAALVAQDDNTCVRYAKIVARHCLTVICMFLSIEDFSGIASDASTRQRVGNRQSAMSLFALELVRHLAGLAQRSFASAWFKNEDRHLARTSYFQRSSWIGSVPVPVF